MANIIQDGEFQQPIGTGENQTPWSDWTHAGITRVVAPSGILGDYASMPVGADLFQDFSTLAPGNYTLSFLVQNQSTWPDELVVAIQQSLGTPPSVNFPAGTAWVLDLPPSTGFVRESFNFSITQNEPFVPNELTFSNSYDAPVAGTPVANSVNPAGTIINVADVSVVSATAPMLTITSAGGLTEQTSQTITGTIDSADVGLTVSIYDGSTLVGTATPATDGVWSATVDLLPTATSQSITAQATNAQGAVGTSNAVAYTLEGTPPTYTVRVVDPGPGVVVSTGDDDVKLFDLSGGDTLIGGTGRELLHASSGNNVLFAGSGLDTLFGGSGDDTLIGGGQSKLIGGSGNASLVGGLTSSAHDTLIGGSGDDTLRVTMGNNHLDAGTGAATLWGGSGADTLNAGAGSHVVMIAGSGAQKLFGGTAGGSDTLTGGMTAASADTMFGGAGSAYLLSNSGDDRMIAGSGDDTLRGGSGNDKMWSGMGHATIYGGTGDDTINLQAGVAATVYAGSGRDKILTGAAGDDTITGGAGTATVYTMGTQGQVANEALGANGYLEISFKGGQILSVKGVQIDFHGGGAIQS